MTAADRYSRQSLAGWNHNVLAAAKVLVVGAGALGNEVLKNLALIGIGSVHVMDFDRVEESNLSRCVLFRDGDLHRPKAVAACARLRELSPGILAEPLLEDIRHGIGAGALRQYSVVLGCVDTIEARMALSQLCRDAGVVLLDGGMDAHGGQVSVFHPRIGPCYTCGMTASMLARVHERQSCLRMGSANRADPAPAAATAVMASSIGALQSQEAVRYLLRETGRAEQPLAPGEKLSLQTRPYGMFVLSSPVSAECPAHDLAPPHHTFEGHPSNTTAATLLHAFQAEELTLSWDVVTALECIHCGSEPVVAPLHRLPQQIACPHCGAHRVPEMQSSLSYLEPLAQHSLAALGVPAQAVLSIGKRTATGDWERLRVELT